jgi:hypothetical protein
MSPRKKPILAYVINPDDAQGLPAEINGVPVIISDLMAPGKYCTCTDPDDVEAWKVTVQGHKKETID